MAEGNKKKSDSPPAQPVKSKGSMSKGSLDLPMKYLVVSGQNEMKISRSVEGRIEDLSSSGLVFQAASMRVDDLHLSFDESPLFRNKITIEIDLPGWRKVTIIGEVSWYERSFVARNLIYHIGVTFLEMKDEDRQLLREYLVAAKREVKAIEVDV